MPEPLKELFNPPLVTGMAGHLARAAPGFDAEGFAARACDGMAALELKARAAAIAAALDAFLPPDWDGVAAMLASLHPEARGGAGGTDARGIRGWAVMPMADVAAARALRLGRFDDGMAALAAMTSRFTGEFAVRPMILADPDRALAHARAWAEHPNEHVRRLASEGTRPRLPWGLRFGTFVADPRPLLPLLAGLRDDPADYVRRSVANSLNDIAKDHPDLVAGLAAEWLEDAPPERARLVRHALRGLVKAGHPAALAALGFPPVAVAATLTLETPAVAFGGTLAFRVVLEGTGRAVLDYAIGYPRARGGSSAKVFKWRELALAGEPVALARRHSFRAVTVRRYRPGRHHVAVLVNGATVAEAAFELLPPSPAGPAAAP